MIYESTVDEQGRRRGRVRPANLSQRGTHYLLICEGVSTVARSRFPASLEALKEIEFKRKRDSNCRAIATRTIRVKGFGPSCNDQGVEA